MNKRKKIKILREARDLLAQPLEGVRQDYRAGYGGRVKAQNTVWTQGEFKCPVYDASAFEGNTMVDVRANPIGWQYCAVGALAKAAAENGLPVNEDGVHVEECHVVPEFEALACDLVGAMTKEQRAAAETHEQGYGPCASQVIEVNDELATHKQVLNLFDRAISKLEGK